LAAKKKKGGGAAWKVGLVVAGAVVLGLVGVAVWGYLALGAPFDPSDSAPNRRVLVHRGESVGAVLGRLEAAGLVTGGPILRARALVAGAYGGMKPGVYDVPKGATTDDAIVLLASGKSKPLAVLTVKPGETVWHVAARFEAEGMGRHEEFLAAASDPESARRLGLPIGEDRKGPGDLAHPIPVEGWLGSETHYFDEQVPPSAVIERLVRAARKIIDRVFADDAQVKATLARCRRRDRLDLVTVASLVEREAIRVDERARIAGVFCNRLIKGMPLATDPTLVYHPDRWGEVPSVKHRKDATSAYNTYVHRGLPPGPIGSPSEASLRAALEPESHGYLYFVAKRDGSNGHAFSTSGEEHERNVERYLRGGARGSQDKGDD